MIHDLLVGHTSLSRVVPNGEGELTVDKDGLLFIDFCQPMKEEAFVSDDGVVIGDMEAGRSVRRPLPLSSPRFENVITFV